MGGPVPLRVSLEEGGGRRLEVRERRQDGGRRELDRRMPEGGGQPRSTGTSGNKPGPPRLQGGGPAQPQTRGFQTQESKPVLSQGFNLVAVCFTGVQWPGAKAVMERGTQSWARSGLCGRHSRGLAGPTWSPGAGTALQSWPDLGGVGSAG